MRRRRLSPRPRRWAPALRRCDELACPHRHPGENRDPPRCVRCSRRGHIGFVGHTETHIDATPSPEPKLRRWAPACAGATSLPALTVIPVKTGIHRGAFGVRAAATSALSGTPKRTSMRRLRLSQNGGGGHRRAPVRRACLPLTVIPVKTGIHRGAFGFRHTTASGFCRTPKRTSVRRRRLGPRSRRWAPVCAVATTLLHVAATPDALGPQHGGAAEPATTKKAAIARGLLRIASTRRGGPRLTPPGRDGRRRSAPWPDP